MSKYQKEQIFQILKGGLIASCQPVDDGPMDNPAIVAAMAQACIDGGAVGLRIEGIDNLTATRPLVNVPIVGIVKRDLADSPVRITPFLKDIDNLVAAGADIIAFDGTDRIRPVEVKEIVKHIQSLGYLSMADCSNLQEGLYCQELGVDFIGSTMSGYTGDIVPIEPDFQLVKDLYDHGCNVIAEGRFNTPELAKAAIECGAYAVTVGSAFTRLEHIVSWFVNSIRSAQ